MKFRFHPQSFIIFVFLFVTEVLIALFVDDSIIRPYGGDVLVVIMIYYFIKAFVKTKPLYICIFTLLFAYMVEISQYFKMVEILGVENNKILVTILGSSFSWGDIFAYTLGVLICYFIDRKK